MVAGGPGARAPQRREMMGARRAPSVLRGRQMPGSSLHTKSRWHAHMRQKKVWEMFLPLRAFENVLMELEIEQFDRDMVAH